MSKLNSKQQRFCAEYIVDFNGTKAAIRAGYSERSAYSQASDLLKKPEIKEFINSLTDQFFSLVGIKKDRVVLELAQLAFDQNLAPNTRIKALGVLLTHWVPDSSKNQGRDLQKSADRVLEALRRFKDPTSIV